MCFSPQRRAIFGHRNYQKWPESVVFSTCWLTNMLRATAACHFWTSQLPKWLRPCGVLCISTDQYASRHSGVPFLNIGTSKMGPGSWCFVHFDLQMCFAPQARGIFHHRNFQNGSGNVVFCAFWLSNVLFATAACHFSPVRRTATSAPAALASLLFEHQEPRFIEKTQRFATSLTFFAHVELLASDSTRMLIFLLVTWLMLIFLLVTWLLCDSAFQLYILSEVRLLNFLRSCIGRDTQMSIHEPTAAGTSAGLSDGIEFLSLLKHVVSDVINENQPWFPAQTYLCPFVLSHVPEETDVKLRLAHACGSPFKMFFSLASIGKNMI